MVLIPDATFPGLRAALEITLTHTCTVTPVRAGAEDHHGNVASVPGTPVTGVPCAYSTITRVARSVDGTTMVEVPTLAAAATGPVVIGSRVSDITDQLGTVLEDGPLVVARVLDDTAGLGAALLPVYELQGAEPVRG